MITIRVVRFGAKSEGLGELIYIGRAMSGGHRLAQSPLANPYHIGADGDRETVIAKYRVWFAEQLEDPESAASREVHRIAQLIIKGQQNVTLICWCAPLACHGDVVREKLWELVGAREKGGMTLEEVRAAAPHTGDVYRIKVKGEKAPRNFYLSRVGPWYIEQAAGGGLEGEIIGFGWLESIEAF